MKIKGWFIKEIRTELWIIQAEMADKLLMSRQQYINIEQWKSSTPIRRLERLCLIFNNKIRNKNWFEKRLIKKLTPHDFINEE